MSSIQATAIRLLLKKSNFWNKPLEQIRADMEKMKGNGFPESVTVTGEVMNGVACNVFFSEASKSSKVLIYYHGGGFCLGIYEANRAFVSGIAEKSGMKVILPDYRLAPEHPYPAALEDAISVYQCLLDRGYPEKDIIVMGDSSGCALALSALLTMKDKGIAMPGAIIFITPVLDLTGSGESFITAARKDPFQLKDPLSLARYYTGENDPSSPVLSPLYGDLNGLPPVLIHAAEYDVFLSDAIRLERQSDAVGGTIKLKVWKKMWHIFHMQAALVPEAKKAMKEINSYLHNLD